MYAGPERRRPRASAGELRRGLRSVNVEPQHADPSVISPAARGRRSVVYASAILAVGAATFWLMLATFSSHLQFDPPAWILEARWWSEFGLAPYRDLVEMKGPGTFLLLRTLLDHTAFALWPVRLTMIGLYVLGAMGFMAAAARLAPLGIAMLAALAWVWLTSHPIFVLTGCYTEELVAIGCAVAVGLMRVTPLGAGMALGLAATAKPLIAGPALFVFFSVGNNRWRVVAGCLAGLIAVYGLMGYLIGYRVVWEHCVVSLVQHGDLDFVGLTPRLATFQDRIQEFFLSPFPWLIPGAVIGALAGLWYRPFDAMLLLLWLLLDVLGVLAQLRGFNHHFVPLILPLMLLCCLPFGALWFPRRGVADSTPWLWVRRGVVVVAAVVACAVAMPAIEERQGMSTEQWAHLVSGDWPIELGDPVEAEVGAYLRAHTDDSERIHVHGQEGITFGIYWEAGRRPASYYYYEGTMSRVFDGHAQAEELARTRPRYIVEISQNQDDVLRHLLETAYAVDATFHGSGQDIHCWRRHDRDLES